MIQPETDGVHDVQRRGSVLLFPSPALGVQVGEDDLRRVVVVVAGAVGAKVVRHHLVDDGVGWYPLVRSLPCTL